jgi:hypothetical protein
MTPPALLAEVAAAGGWIEARGDRLRLMARGPLPPDLVERVRAMKPALLTILGEAADWRARHREALAHWSALHPAAEAAGISWGELQGRWHRLRGERVSEWQCAGCRAPIGGCEALALGDGARVHLDTLDCLARYGRRWRGEASLGRNGVAAADRLTRPRGDPSLISSAASHPPGGRARRKARLPNGRPGSGSITPSSRRGMNCGNGSGNGESHDRAQSLCGTARAASRDVG